MEMFASKPIVQEGFNKRFEHSKEGNLLVLPKPCFWKEQLFTIEKENNCEGVIMYVLYTDSVSGTWRVQAVPEMLGSFSSRKG